MLKKLPWLEIVLVSASVCLVLLFFEAELSRWWHSPSPGRIGIDYLDQDFGHSCIAEAFVVGLPPAYHQQTDWPALLYLHGAGERGNDPNLLRGIAKRLTCSHEGAMPAVVLMPQCRTECRWRANDVRSFLTMASRDYDIDPDRIYLIGYSMGGYGTWNTAAAYPDLFAAIVPIAGGGDCESASKLVSIPSWTFHGEKDGIVLASESTNMVDAIRNEGGSPKLTLYPEWRHFIHKLVLETPELWTWLFEQNLQDRRLLPQELEPASKKQ